MKNLRVVLVKLTPEEIIHHQIYRSPSSITAAACREMVNNGEPDEASSIEGNSPGMLKTFVAGVKVEPPQTNNFLVYNEQNLQLIKKEETICIKEEPIEPADAIPHCSVEAGPTVEQQKKSTMKEELIDIKEEPLGNDGAEYINKLNTAGESHDESLPHSSAINPGTEELAENDIISSFGHNDMENKRYHLKQHSATNTRHKIFECSECEYKTGNKSHLTAHLRTHTGIKPFSCSHCDYKTAYKGALNVHLRSHTGDKPFSCSHCDYKTAHKGALAVHLSSHTGVKPFGCSHCDYKTAVKSRLIKHLKTHTAE